jgi:hypothetical protein
MDIRVRGDSLGSRIRFCATGILLHQTVEGVQIFCSYCDRGCLVNEPYVAIRHQSNCQHVDLLFGLYTYEVEFSCMTSRV